jgi:aromatic ring-cleaving dioxygenase
VRATCCNVCRETTKFRDREMFRRLVTWTVLSQNALSVLVFTVGM